MIPAVQRALDSVTDDTAVDWSALHAESTADPDIDSTLRALHDIAAIAKAHHHPDVCLHTLPFRWGPLEAREFLARGAHGDVYRAWDPRLERDVALKLIRHDDGGADRPFSIAEGRLLARVRHPHVVAVFGADRVDGQDGIWMELVEGRTLRDSIEHNGAMPAREAVRVGAAVCEGLAAVHAAGLIHRDIKAQNVVVDRSGRTILMDLGAGIDEAVEPAGKEGTPIYLAPEVLEGGAPSRASDIYAVGVLMFFLLTGRYPVTAASIPQLREAHRGGRRERLARTGVAPPSLAVLVDRALSPDPSERPADAGALAAALRQALAVPPRRTAIVAGAAAALALIAGAFVWTAASVSRPAAERPWVLIAPFQNLTGEPRFDGGIDAALAHELNASSSVNVVPPERVEDALRLMRHDPRAPVDERIAREAALRDGQVRFVAAGALSKRRDGYALAVRLVDPSSGATIAAGEWPFTGQAEVGDALRDASRWLRGSAGASGGQLDAAPFDKGTTRSLEAFRLFADALRSARVSRWAEAEAALTAALDIDPEFASAHTWKGWAALNLGRTADARASARRGLELAGGVSPRERAFIRASFFLVHQDIPRALGELEAMVRRYPDDYWATYKLGQQYLNLGRAEDFREMALRVLALRPRDLNSHADAVRATVLTKGAEAAVPLARDAMHLRAELGPGAANPLHIGYLELLPVHAALASLDTVKASRLLDAADAAAPDNEPDWQRYRRASFRLALGQMRLSELTLGGMRDAQQQAFGVAWIHLARRDAAAASAVLRQYQGFDYAAVSMLVRVGDVDGARAALERIGPRDARNFQWARAEIDVATSNTEAARRVLREGVDVFRRITGVRAFLYAQTLAEGLRKAGQPQAAVDVLAPLTPLRDRLFGNAGSTGAQWLDAQDLLTRLHREMGRPELAIPVEREMLAVLASADAGHPLVQALLARR